MKPIARVNKLLAAAGRTERLTRNSAGGGYYYVIGCVFGPSLYVYALDDTPEDHATAQKYVEECIEAESLRNPKECEPFRFPVQS